MERNKDFKGKPSPLLSVCTGGDTIMLLLKLNQEKENSWDLTAHHPAICHASAAVRSSLVLQTELDRTGQTGQADWGWNFFFFLILNFFFKHSTEYGPYFSIKCIQHPWTLPTIPEPHVFFLLMRSNCSRKIQKAKKIFFLANFLFTTEVLFC